MALLATRLLAHGLGRNLFALSAGMVLALASACSHTPTAPPAKPAPRLLDALSDQDIKAANRQVQRALETLVSGNSLTWKSKTSDHFGRITPIRTYKSKGGAYCRVYTEAITINGVTEHYDGTACRSKRGSWEPV